MAPAEARYLETLQSLVGNIWYVHVEQYGPARRSFPKALDQLERDARRRGIVLSGLARERDRERRNTEQIALGCRRDSPRVDGVIAHVRAQIDAGDDHVGHLLEQSGHGEVNAVRRRAVYELEAVRGFAHRKRPIQGERVGGAAAVALGCDYGDARKAGERFCKDRDAGREVPVVVAEQNAHFYSNPLTTERSESDCVEARAHAAHSTSRATSSSSVVAVGRHQNNPEISRLQNPQQSASQFDDAFAGHRRRWP